MERSIPGWVAYSASYWIIQLSKLFKILCRIKAYEWDVIIIQKDASFLSLEKFFSRSE